MKSGCATRNHRWDQGDPPKCLDCQKIKGSRPRRKPRPDANEAGAPSPTPAGRIPNEALRARWGLHQPAQAPAQPETAQEPAQEPTESAKPKASSSGKVDVTSVVKGELPDALIALEQKSIRWLGRKPEDPADILKEKFDEGFAKLSSEHLPKIEISPLAACLVFGGALWLQMFLQGEKMQPAPKQQSQRPAAIKATADATTESATAPTYPESSSRTPDLRVVEPAGSASGAAESALED